MKEMENTESKKQLLTLDEYFSNFEQPERACAFLEGILVYPVDAGQWAVGGFITMLDTIANQQSIEDVKTYVGALQSHLLSNWTTKEMPESVLRLGQRTNKTN